jgi:hypothetical protein
VWQLGHLVEYAHNACDNFVVDDSLAVFTDDVDSEFLTKSDKKMKVRSEVGTYNDII